MVSVIVATNRAGEFFDEALRSVEAQTYPHWEIIVVDDGSPDPDALRAIVGDRPNTRVVRQRSSGVSVARNVGIAESRGEYLAFLDDDDAWLPDRLALQVRALEADHTAVAAYGRVTNIDEHGNELHPANQREATGLASIFDGSATPQPQTITARRSSVIRVGGFHSGLVHSEDLDLTLRLARDGGFVFIDAPLTRYRKHGGNNSSAHRYQTATIDRVLRLHLLRADQARDETYSALLARLRANNRYAYWIARRATRGRGGRSTLSELWWAFRFAPLAPADAVLRRMLRRRDR